MSEKLYNIIRTVLEEMGTPTIPNSIKDNIKQPLREYQKEAIENFLFYRHSKKYSKILNKHLLFHLATGSGKTNLIASTILYLYELGYRDFKYKIVRTKS